MRQPPLPLLNKPIDMAVPKVQLLPFEQIAESVGGSEQLVLAVFLRVEGSAPGNLFFIMSPEAGKNLLQNLAGFEVSDEEQFSEMEQSALCEIGNILSGSYLSSLADLTNLSMTPTVPALAMDMAGAILSYGLAVRRNGRRCPLNQHDVPRRAERGWKASSS